MAGNESTGKCPQLKPHSGLILSDPKGNESTYSYGSASAMLRLATITSDGVGTVGYTYNDYGAITGISRDTTYYVFTYDDWGNVIDTKVGNIV
ncbi:MAG: hypothetical protein K6F68_01080, partial [Clostridiales bacterium]|nr:hypothetical protein [Clostridiales bacterium]